MPFQIEDKTVCYFPAVASQLAFGTLSFLLQGRQESGTCTVALKPT